MIPLSEASKILKNSLIDDGVWYVLITFTNKDNTVTIRVVNNRDNVTFNGNEFVAFPIQLSEVTQSNKGELPSINISISNIDRIVEGYIENDPDLGSGWSVHIDIVHQNSLESGVAEITYDFITTSVTADANMVTFVCGMRNPLRQQFPRLRFLPNTCQNTFKQGACTYSGSDTECRKTLEACKEKFPGVKKLPFLGFPGIPGGAVYV